MAEAETVLNSVADETDVMAPETSVRPITLPKKPGPSGRAPKAFKAGSAAPKSSVKPAKVRKDAQTGDKGAGDTVKSGLEGFDAVQQAATELTAEMAGQKPASFSPFNGKVSEVVESNMKSINEFNEFAKGNFEALIESAKAAASGAETLAAQIVENSKKSVEETQACLKSLTAVKSPNELISVQQEFAKAQFDKAVANWSALTETWMKLAGEVVQPLSNRVAIATDTMKKSMNV